MSLPIHLQVEKRLDEPPRWMPVATSVGAIVLAFLISGVILLLIGGDPVKTFSTSIMQLLAAGERFRM